MQDQRIVDTVKKRILYAVISTVPQWYHAKKGPHRRAFSLNDVSVKYFSPNSKSPRLRRLERFVKSNLDSWFSLVQQMPVPGAVRLIQDMMAIEWLHAEDPEIEWSNLLEHCSHLRYRTYENEPVIVNFVLSEKEGSVSITDPLLQKYLDPLATSQQVFMRLDKKLRLSDYEEVPWSAIEDTEDYKFNPEFLQPFSSSLRAGEYSVHQTGNGDLIIMNRRGILASNRKGQWSLYDTYNFSIALKAILTETFGTHDQSAQKLNHRVGSHLFEIICDLGYKRHGALLIYDPNHKVIGQLTNPESVLGPRPSAAKATQAYDAIGRYVREIGIGSRHPSKRMKRLFLEIASVDGAVIFDAHQLLAFGAMVRPHDQASHHHGTRTTAAYSAYFWGGFPIKISADGDVLIVFSSKDSTGSSVAELRFS